jgi:type VI secretion system secreted protein VgrG
MKVVLEAGSELTLKAGGSFIKIDGSGVAISGPVVNVNDGGSPGNGTGAAPLLPGALKQADADIPRILLQQRLSENNPIVELCLKPKGGTPMQCPLTDCPCRKTFMAGTQA